MASMCVGQVGSFPQQDELDGEIAAMQFAGGRSLAQLAVDWDRDIGWVEVAVRRALLATIPQREGGLKPAREVGRRERREEASNAMEQQGVLNME